eukprot:COSAG04_NODE_1335_length_7178_cov_14.567679_2_plen_139_part_00
MAYIVPLMIRASAGLPSTCTPAAFRACQADTCVESSVPVAASARADASSAQACAPRPAAAEALPATRADITRSTVASPAGTETVRGTMSRHVAMCVRPAGTPGCGSGIRTCPSVSVAFGAVVGGFPDVKTTSLVELHG